VDPLSPAPGTASEPRRLPTTSLRDVLWFWTKVVLVLVVLDALLFGRGWFWSIRPGPGAEVRGLWDLARRLEAPATGGPRVVALGDWAVRRSLLEGCMERRMAAHGVAGTFHNLALEGTDTTDAAILAYAGRGLDPWLVLYGASFADFKPDTRTSALQTLFADSGMGLETLWPETLDGRLGYVVKRYWTLYKFRAFVRGALRQEIQALVDAIPGKAHA